MVKIAVTKIAFVFMLIVLVSIPVVSQAATQQVTISSLGYSEDLVVSGARTSTTINFPLPAVTLLPGSMVNLILDPGPKLSGWSSFSFYINNRLASTVPVSQLWTNSTVKLPIPANSPVGQPLRLDIKTNIAAGDDVNTDSLNGYLYYTLRNTSNMVLSANQSPAKTPAGFFLGLGSGLVVIIPDNPSAGEIAAGAWAFGMIKKSFSYLPVTFVFASERNQYLGQPRVWVSTRSRLPAALVPATQGTTLMDPETVVITADDDAGLKTEVQRLATMLSQGTPLGASNNALGMAADKNKEIVYFGQTEVHEGIASIPIEFDIFPSMLAEAPRKLIFHLDGRYSASGSNPRMQAFFNGNLIHSETLNDSGVLKRDIVLPKSLALSTKNTLRIEFNYPAAKEFQGVGSLVQTAQILSSSYFVGMGSFPTDKYGWDSIGLRLSKNGVILLDGESSPDKIKSAAEAVYMINRQLPPGEFTYPEFRSMADYKEITNAAYLFAIGMADEIPEALMQDMPLRNIRDDNAYHSSQKGRDQGKNLVIGQIGRYRDIPVMMIAAASDSARLAVALRTLNVNQKLAGNIFILNEDGSLMSMDRRDRGIMASFQQDGIDVLVNYGREAIRWIEQYREILSIVLGLIIATLLLVKMVALIRRRLRRRSDVGQGRRPKNLSNFTGYSPRRPFQ